MIFALSQLLGPARRRECAPNSMEASMRHNPRPAFIDCEGQDFVIETKRPGCEPTKVVRWFASETDAALEAVKDADGAAVNVWPLDVEVRARVNQAMYFEQFIGGGL